MAQSSVGELTIFRRNLGERIRFCADSIGKRGEAASSAGVSAEQLNKWIAGTVKVPVEALRSLSQAANVDFSWLATGEGHPPRGGPSQIRLQDSVSKNPPQAGDSDFAFLPFYADVSAAAGSGAAVISDAAHSVIGFARDLLRETGASPQNCTVIRATGDSMSPTLPEGALLVVDHSQREIVANGSIMVIGVDDDLLVKRVRRRIDGLIELISDNTTYAPETLGPAALQQLRVIGRVVYFCRTP